MTSLRKQILRDFVDTVWSGGGIEAIDRFLAPRYTIHHDPGDPWDGQTLDVAGFKERVRQSRAPFPDQRFDLLEMLEDGDRIAVTWFWTGIHKGDIPDFPASGRTVTMSGATVYIFDGDRLAGHWQIADRLSVYRQLMA